MQLISPPLKAMVILVLVTNLTVWLLTKKPEQLTGPGMEIYELYSLSRVVSTSKLTPDWLRKSEQPIRSQGSKLTQLLT